MKTLPVSLFCDLEENDILFIDSSHMIRPEGDVLFEYLQILPSLKQGVIVHLHDIFSPRNYPHSWLVDDVKFWNEQYLLEAFLTHNASWKVIGALNFLHHNHHHELKQVAPFLVPEDGTGLILYPEDRLIRGEAASHLGRGGVQRTPCHLQIRVGGRAAGTS